MNRDGEMFKVFIQRQNCCEEANSQQTIYCYERSGFVFALLREEGVSLTGYQQHPTTMEGSLIILPCELCPALSGSHHDL